METILSLIRENCGFNEMPVYSRKLHGGDINLVFLIRADGNSWVVKQNDALDFPYMLEKEGRALKFLHNNSPIYYPKPLKSFSEGEQQFLVMEFVEEGNNSVSGQKKLGRKLAEQHKITHESFGWEEDNYIGSLPQANDWMGEWIEFYVTQRILPLVRMAFDDDKFNRTEIQKIERFNLKLNELIPEEKPALLHGDLWAGNYFISTEDEPIVYDPAVYFGHREMDIAMTKMFGGFSYDFYEAYEEYFPLEKGWNSRRGIFQLYPNLVHLNLFGGSYKNAILDVVFKF